MIAKTIVFLTCLTYILEGSVIPITANEETCVDAGEFCAVLFSYCDSHPELKEICPQTCGICKDPCSDNNGGCNHYCSGLTEPVCTCRDGYQLGYDQKTCLDINECASETNPCSEESFCVNTPGSYSCQLINCQSLETGFKNYYKSNTCCIDHVPLADQAEEDRRQFERLLNDREADTQWPWMAQILNKAEVIDQHLCGGVLIAQNWIATSTLCVKNFKPDDLKVVLGNVRNQAIKSQIKSSSEERKIIKIISHPDSSNNDISLLKLSEPVKYNQLIQPVTLPCGERPDVGSICYATGFGHKDEKSSSTSETLKEIALPIVSSSYCEIAYGKTSTIFDSQTMMCAGHINGGEDACFGDGGGPLVCQRKDSCEWYLSGIISTGKGCGRIGYPGIYSNVFHFEEWIGREIGNEFISSCSN